MTGLVLNNSICNPVRPQICHPSLASQVMGLANRHHHTWLCFCILNRFWLSHPGCAGTYDSLALASHCWDSGMQHDAGEGIHLSWEENLDPPIIIIQSAGLPIRHQPCRLRMGLFSLESQAHRNFASRRSKLDRANAIFVVI